MTIDKRNESQKTGVSTAPAVIQAGVQPVAALKANRLRADEPVKTAKQDKPFQTTLNNLTSGPNALSEEDVAYRDYMRRVLFQRTMAEIAENNKQPDVLSIGDILARKELSQSDFLRADTRDPSVADMPVGEVTETDGRRRYLIGEHLQNYLAEHQPTTTRIGKPSSGPDTFVMRNIGEVQREMYDGIKLAAQVTGVPEKLLGAMAGKETVFGKNQKSGSGAEGLFQQTDGYLLANYVNNPEQSKFIAKYVPEAAKYMQDGKIDLAEAQRLQWNPAAAAIMTALRAQSVARDLKVDLNDQSSWALVYTDHNAGRGSLNKLLKGGMTDEWIQKLNPSMYAGAKNAQDVIEIAAKDMAKWGDRYETLKTTIGISNNSNQAKIEAMQVIAAAQNSSRTKHPAPAAPEPA